jgi:hypothetical protein
MLEGLSVINIDGTKDPHGLFYVVIKTAERRRAAQIQDAIQHWNSECPASKIILQPITPFPPICTFKKSLDSSYSNHIIVKRILADKAKKAAGLESNYFSSNDTEIEEDPFPVDAYATEQQEHPMPAMGPGEAAQIREKCSTYKHSCATSANWESSLGKRQAPESECNESETSQDHVDQHSLQNMFDVMTAGFRDLRQLLADETQKSTGTIIEAVTSSAEELRLVVEEKGACEQHVVEELQQAEKTRNSLAQTVKGNVTKDLKKKHRAEILELKKQHALELQEAMHDQPQKIADFIISRKQHAGLGDAEDLCIYNVDPAERDRLKGTIGYSQIVEFEAALGFLKYPYTGLRDIPTRALSLDTVRRYLDWNIETARVNVIDCANSAPQHRFEIGKISGPTFAKDVFKRMQIGLVNQIKGLSDMLGKQHPEDIVVEYAPTANSFFLPEVFFLIFSDLFSC